ncbi:hypothetical protein [Vibrio anguillarum]|nr:hypothetical protein [Vibrio anguillarum]ATC56324.1 hypothetical protein CMV05_00525 [Vibrio anguillarum]MBF4253343.1 hypothetical protein [Vibrio anguillarum]MBF4388307.1 hypothetical protein [Vibrio anguillarum]MBF4405155.1 hypothetical protein [Vibrio anguillarum]
MTEHEALILPIAHSLGEDLLKQVAFVGGATVSLHLDDAQPIDISSTKDVDFIVSVSSYYGYQQLSEELGRRGFKLSIPEKGDEAPMCRFECAGILVDVMPDKEDILGFSNPWFQVGLKESVPYTLPDGLEIKIAQAKHLLATKLVAFATRAQDMLSSKDAEDIVVLVNGRDSLLDEVKESPIDLREFIQTAMSEFKANSDFDYLLMNALDGEEEERIEIIEERFNNLSSREFLL